MRRILISVLLIAAMATPTVGQQLQGTLKKIKDAGALTIGYRES